MMFAEKLKHLRATAGLSQAKLAQASGRSLGAIRDYEQGKREPSLKAAAALAEVLGVTCEAFAGCDDVKPTPEVKKRGSRGKKMRH